MTANNLCEAVKNIYKDPRKAINSLIQEGHNVNAFDKQGDCPLSLACKNGDMNTVEYLVNLGACVNVTNNSGKSPLGSAVEHRKTDVVKYLLERGAYVDILNLNHQTPLIIASNQNKQLIELLVEHGANLTAQDMQGESALSYSIKSEQKDNFEYLRKAIIKQMYELFQYDSQILREILKESINLNRAFKLNQDHIRVFNSIDPNTDCGEEWFFSNKSIWEYFSSFEFKEKFLVDVVQHLRENILETLEIGKKKLMGKYPQLGHEGKMNLAPNPSNICVSLKRVLNMTLGDGLFEILNKEQTEEMELRKAKTLYNSLSSYSNQLSQSIQDCDQLYSAVDEKSTKLAAFYQDHIADKL
jgi:hypothetical protein